MRFRDSSSSSKAPAPRPPAEPAESAPYGVWLEDRQSKTEERVLAEIAHELGNFFHKLYYWAEFLQEKRADHSAETTAGQMLTHTIGGLEEFLKGTLDYFRPLELSPVSTPVADVVASMVVQLRAQLHGWPVRIGDPGALAGRRVLIDPARLPAVFLAVGRRLTERAPAGSGVYVGVEARGDVLEAVFRVEGGFGAVGFQTAESCIDWALAERIVALHRGRLEEGEPNQPGGGPPALVLTLPFHGQ